MSILSNMIDRFDAIPIKMPMMFFTDTLKKPWNFYKATKDNQSNLEKEEKKMEASDYLISKYIKKLQ